MCISGMGASLLSAGMGIMGGVMEGAGAKQQALTKQANHEANAKLKRREAEIEKVTSEFDVQQTDRQLLRITGAQRAEFAGRGLQVEGSATDVIDDSIVEGALDIAAIRWSSKLKQDNLEYEAKIEDMNAGSAKKAAGIAFIGPVFGAVTRAVGSFA